MLVRGTDYGLAAIRVGLGGVLVWFGYQQLTDVANWTGYVPDEIVALGYSLETLVYINGAVEVIFGLMLIGGLFTRFAGAVMALHLVSIAYSLGYNEIAIRDYGLAFGYLGLALATPDAFTIDTMRKKSKMSGGV